MSGTKKVNFDPGTYLVAAGLAKKTVKIKPKHAFYAQGSAANAIFYLESGRAKLTVVSKRGKEATVTLLAAGDFAGEEAITAGDALRTASASALIACIALKIDRTFIRDITTKPDDASIASAIITLAHSLKLKVIAEGVETGAQLDFLRSRGCDEMQGYYFSRPLNIADCSLALREDRRLPVTSGPMAGPA